jgi:tight adherence protein C
VNRVAGKLRRRRSGDDVAAILSSIVDGLRSGLSLRHAVLRTAGTDGSPACVAPVRHGLDAGRPLNDVLRSAAAHAEDVDVRCALSVLAAHADAGGDPVPAVSALATRLRRRQAARREARALTTQARLGARAILLLTPGFWLLLLVSDARHTLGALTKSGPRSAVVCGVVLQLLGAAWIGAIVRQASPASRPGRLESVPFLRAGRALVGGRRSGEDADDIADAAETIAFVLDAGRSPSAALESVAPLVGGKLGWQLTGAVSRIRAGARVADAVRDASAGGGEAHRRFAEAFVASIDLGVPLAPALRDLADDAREASSADVQESVRRASVRVLLPLGLLILPAFLLSCLVPLFAGGLFGISGT